MNGDENIVLELVREIMRLNEDQSSWAYRKLKEWSAKNPDATEAATLKRAHEIIYKAGWL
jgi:hypothetical protein